MINTLLEHVPIKMEVKEIEEVADNLACDEMAKDDDEIDETDEELDEDEEEDDEDEEEEDEESDTESDALEIEQQATMLISSDEEAELEAQRIRFPDIAVTRKSHKDSNKSSRSSSRNSQASYLSSKTHLTKEIILKKDTKEETNKKQKISPRLKNLENNKSLESSNKENNQNTKTLLKKKMEHKKLDSNKVLENHKNKHDDTTSKRLDNNKTSSDSHINLENIRNIENLLKSPSQKSRRGSNNSTCSVSSSVASESAETESCGNIYVFNLQQKLIFNCQFCDLKYGDLENFGRHLHEAHNVFNFDTDHEKENAPRNLRKSNRMPTNTSKNAANVKKEPLQCVELLAEQPVALPPSVLAEPLDSCGNVFMINHRKLFLVCGYCECKYANLDLFEKHLRQQHRIFEGCRNEVNVVPKVEVKEEVFIITEVVEKPDIIAAQAMVAIPADIPLNISITPETEQATVAALEETMETTVEANKELSTSACPSSKVNSSEVVKSTELENPATTLVSSTKENNKLAEVESNKKTFSPKKTRSKRRISPVESVISPNKRQKRNTRNSTKDKKESITTNVEEDRSEKSSESEKNREQIAEDSKVIEIRNTKKSTNSAESKEGTPSETVETKEINITTKPSESELITSLQTTENRETRKSTKAGQTKKPTTTLESKETRKTRKCVESKKQTPTESKSTKEIPKSTKSPPTNKLKQEKPETETETDEIKLKCSMCPKEFARRDTLKIHERTHTGEKPYTCDICDKSFGARANLCVHKKFHLGDSYKKYKCEICDKKFFRNTDRKVHMSSHSNEKRFKCGICLRGYSSKLSVKKHMEREHATDVKIKNKSSRKENLTNTKVEQDNTLPEMSTNTPSLIEPMQETPLPQEHHEMDYGNADPVNDIIEQLQMEMGANETENVEANAVTFTINTLPNSAVSDKSSESVPIIIASKLMQVDSTDDIKPQRLKIVKRFFCDVCSRTFEKHIRLVEHKRLHTGEKPFTCDECGKQFRIRMRLTEHKLRHSKEKKFKCEICQLGCCTKQDLNLHMRHHTNDRRYKCSVCPKAFVRSSDLKIHIRIHTGEKPYVCDICHKCFRANQNLSVHKKSHMGEASKNYKCEHCEKKFMRNMDRKIHMRSHTGEKPYKCEICQRGYSSKVNVRTHIERDHISANGVGTPPKGKKKPGPKSRALKEELEKQKKLIEELQHQLLQQIKTDEKIIPLDEDMLEQHALQDSTITATSPLSTNSKIDPIQSAYELLNKLKSSTPTPKPLTVLPSPPPLEEPTSNPFTKARKDSTNLLITQKLEQPSPASSSSSTSCLTPSLPKTTATKVVSQKTSLGIQQVSVTVSMQVENVTPNSTTPEKENSSILTTSSSGTTSVKKERKITSYFTVVGQKAEA